jgi:hypothetical protein
MIDINAKFSPLKNPSKKWAAGGMRDVIAPVFFKKLILNKITITGLNSVSSSMAQTQVTCPTMPEGLCPTQTIPPHMTCVSCVKHCTAGTDCCPDTVGQCPPSYNGHCPSGAFVACQ